MSLRVRRRAYDTLHECYTREIHVISGQYSLFLAFLLLGKIYRGLSMHLPEEHFTLVRNEGIDMRIHILDYWILMQAGGALLPGKTLRASD